MQKVDSKREFWLNVPPPHLICPVCNDVFSKCTKTPCCSKLFCHDCITTNCPNCNSLIDPKKLEPMKKRDEEVGNLQVECETRCGWTGNFSQETEHLKDCDVFNQIQHDVCGWKGNRKDLPNHIKKECSETIIPCEKSEFGCKWKDSRSKYKEHKISCFYFTEVAQITFNYVQKLQ